MANSFLDKTGLTYLWGKIVALVNRKQDALTFDSTPTENSTNPVTSGGVKAYVDANAGGGNSPVESGSGTGSVQTKAYTAGSVTHTQTASGEGAFAEGGGTQATSTCSHAEGYNTIADGLASHSEGYAVTYKQITLTCSSKTATTFTYTGSVDSNDVGNYVYCTSFRNNNLHKITAVNTSSNTITVAESPYAKLTNETAFIIHHGAFGNSAHCEGLDTIAVGDYAHSEGCSTVAEEDYSHAEGCHTQASGQYSHAEGYYTTAQGANQHVEGKFNVIDTSNKYAHITGIGTSATARKNGFTVDWQGNGVFAGTVMSKNNQRLVDSGECYDIVERAMERRIVQIGTSDDYGPGRRALEVGEETDWRPIFGDELGANNPLGCSYLVYLRITQVYDETSGVSTDTYIPLTKFITYSDSSATGGYTVKYIFGSNEYTFVDSGDYVIPESDFVPAT